MSKSMVSRRSVAARFSRGVSMMETLECRQFLSASPVIAPDVVKAPPPVLQYSKVSPGKILAGGKVGTETVTIHNYTTLPVTDSVSITVAPSLDGVTAAGSFGSAGVTETVTINKKGKVNVKVPFVPPTTLVAGKYHTLVTVDLNGTTTTATAPGTYTLTLPPEPTTTPSLIGKYVGLITAIRSESTGFFGGGTSTTVHEASFIWETVAQDLTSLTGLFAVGDQNAMVNGDANNNSMQGYELTNGVIHYTLTADNMTYTIDGKVSANGTTITGKFKGTLQDNIFAGLGGTFKLKEQT